MLGNAELWPTPPDRCVWEVFRESVLLWGHNDEERGHNREAQKQDGML